MTTEQRQLGHTQTDTTPTTGEPSSSNAADPDEATDQSGPPTELSEENLTEHTAEEAIAHWTERMEATGDHHAYLHLKVTMYRDLAGTYWGIDIEKRKQLVDNDRTTYGGYWGRLSPDPDEVVPTVIDWLVDTLSTPYLPPENHDYPLGHWIRAVPIDNIQIFLSDAARDCFKTKDIPIGPVETALEDCAELPPTEAYLDTLEASLAAKDAEDRLQDRVRRLEQTVRATFPTLSHRTSDPAPEFEDLSPTELKAALATARDAHEDSTKRRKDLRAALESMQADVADHLQMWFHQQLPETT